MGDAPSTPVDTLLGWVGRSTLDFFDAFGRFWIFSGRTLVRTLPSLMRRRDLQRLLPQFYAIGTQSVSVIMITGMFVGMVLAIQAIEQFQAAGLTQRMGVIVSLSVVRELGPVLAGVMLAGRVGGALTAELGTMNVTEQIDALRSMGSDPARVLAVPRFLSCLLLTPVLTLYCDLMGVYGGWFICVPIFKVSEQDFWNFTEVALESWDIWSGLIKSVFFGASIGLISTFKGFHCKPGAQGVGKACTEAFVSSFVTILVLDFFISIVLKAVYEAVWGFKEVF